MNTIPAFDLALQEFKKYLASNGLPTRIEWIFRDDVCPRNIKHIHIRWPLFPGNTVLTKKVYSEGRRRGMVDIRAIGGTKELIYATVWFPKFPDEEVQGWNSNLKLSISEPLPIANHVSKKIWPVIMLTRKYRRYQKHVMWIGKRSWAAV